MTTKLTIDPSLCRHLLVVVSLGLSSSDGNSDDTGNSTASPPFTSKPAKVFLADDQSGEELASDHGIKPIQVSDLNVLVSGVVASQRPVTLFHELIDEDASDNEVRVLVMEPFTGGAPPQKPDTS
ncbi:MAG: hypothetical protein AAF491_05165, partial [Verrucomicrobiota bacterium]